MSFLPVDAKGQIVYDQMEQALCENTKAVIVTHASNVTGNVTDLSRVADFVHAYGLFLIVDAAQTAGIYQLMCSGMALISYVLPDIRDCSDHREPVGFMCRKELRCAL